jgi:hypothetical protein
MAALSFWLSNCVFLADTTTYPKREIATSWDLAVNRASGFSGTNDNHRLLPSQVRQHEPAVPELQATNGEMLGALLAHTIAIKITSPQADWKEIIRQAVSHGATALIDCGSLLAGCPKLDIAKYLSTLIAHKDGLFGVVYHNGSDWFLLDKSDQQVALHRSAHRERDAFVFFDDAHSRGADMVPLLETFFF